MSDASRAHPAAVGDIFMRRSALLSASQATSTNFFPASQLPPFPIPLDEAQLHSSSMNTQRFAFFCAALAALFHVEGVDAQSLRGLQAFPSTSAFSQLMLDAVNEQRINYGLPPLCYNKKLNAAAQAHSEDQARNKRMTHTGSNGSSIGQRVTAQNFEWNNVGENVAAGQRDVASVMEAWMNSPGHRDNILNRDFTFFGMGFSTGGETPYWTQNFGSGATEECDNSSTTGSTDTPLDPPSDTPSESPEAAMEQANLPVLDTVAPISPCPSVVPAPMPTPAATQLKPRSLCPNN